MVAPLSRARGRSPRGRSPVGRRRGRRTRRSPGCRATVGLEARPAVGWSRPTARSELGHGERPPGKSRPGDVRRSAAGSPSGSRRPAARNRSSRRPRSACGSGFPLSPSREGPGHAEVVVEVGSLLAGGAPRASSAGRSRHRRGTRSPAASRAAGWPSMYCMATASTSGWVLVDGSPVEPRAEPGLPLGCPALHACGSSRTHVVERTVALVNRGSAKVRAGPGSAAVRAPSVRMATTLPLERHRTTVRPGSSSRAYCRSARSVATRATGGRVRRRGDASPMAPPRADDDRHHRPGGSTPHLVTRSTPQTIAT